MGEEARTPSVLFLVDAMCSLYVSLESRMTPMYFALALVVITVPFRVIWFPRSGSLERWKYSLTFSRVDPDSPFTVTVTVHQQIN